MKSRTMLKKVSRFWLEPTETYRKQWDGYTEGDEGPDKIHIESDMISDHSTLCGLFNINEYTAHETLKRPTCSPCLSVWKHVKEHKL